MVRGKKVKQNEKLKQFRYLEHYLCPEVVEERLRSASLLGEIAPHRHKGNVPQQAHGRWEVRGVKDHSWFEVHPSPRKDRLIIQGKCGWTDKRLDEGLDVLVGS